MINMKCKSSSGNFATGNDEIPGYKLKYNSISASVVFNSGEGDDRP